MAVHSERRKQRDLSGLLGESVLYSIGGDVLFNRAHREHVIADDGVVDQPHRGL